MHFAEKELSRALGFTYSESELLNFLFVALLSTNSFLYVTMASLWESLYGLPDIKKIVIDLASKENQFILVLSNQKDYKTFLQSRYNMYETFDKAKYDCYFNVDKKNDILMWVDETHDAFDNKSTTSIIKNYLESVTERTCHSISLSNDTKRILDKGLQEQKNEAIVTALFSKYAKNSQTDEIDSISKIITVYYIKRHLDMFNGTILKNIPNFPNIEEMFYSQGVKNPFVNYNYLINNFFFNKFGFINKKFNSDEQVATIVKLRNSPYFSEFLKKLYSLMDFVGFILNNESSQHKYFFIRDIFNRIPISKDEIEDLKKKNIPNDFLTNAIFYLEKAEKYIMENYPPINLLKLHHNEKTIMLGAQTIILKGDVYMSRIINMKGNNLQYVEKAETVTQNNYYGDQSNFPETLTAENWGEILAFFEEFIESEESDELKKGDYNKLKEEVEKAKHEDKMSGKGWERIRNFLSDTANATTIISAIATFATAHGDRISQWITGLFTH